MMRRARVCAPLGGARLCDLALPDIPRQLEHGTCAGYVVRLAHAISLYLLLNFVYLFDMDLISTITTNKKALLYLHSMVNLLGQVLIEVAVVAAARVIVGDVAAVKNRGGQLRGVHDVVVVARSLGNLSFHY